MSKKREIDPAYYETHDFGDELEEAARNGTLIVTKPGENALDSIKRYMQEKKKTETVSVRLPKPLVAAIKKQAKSISVPWTAYIREIIETSVGRIAKRTA